jgi:hypothetical protein
MIDGVETVFFVWDKIICLVRFEFEEDEVEHHFNKVTIQHNDIT